MRLNPAHQRSHSCFCCIQPTLAPLPERPLGVGAIYQKTKVLPLLAPKIDDPFEGGFAPKQDRDALGVPVEFGLDIALPIPRELRRAIAQGDDVGAPGAS